MTPEEIRMTLVNVNRNIGVLCDYIGDKGLGDEIGMYMVTLRKTAEELDADMDKLMTEICK